MSHRRHANKTLKILLGSVAAVVLAGLSLSVQAGSADDKRSSIDKVDASAYLIQAGDVLQVSVWKEADLQQEVLVRPDGGITLPLAGNLQASGVTVIQLAEAIAEQIRRYIPDPVVTVALKQLGGNQVFVLGKVNRPGAFPFAKPLDVMQALSMAGGATPYASLSSIRILRRDAKGLQQSFKFDYTDVERGKSLAQNLILQSGDTVVVP